MRRRREHRYRSRWMKAGNKVSPSGHLWLLALKKESLKSAVGALSIKGWEPGLGDVEVIGW